MFHKTPDTKAYQLLREILQAYESEGSFAEITKMLEDEMRQVRWYLQDKDACEFVKENGNKCRKAAVRIVFSIPCCEEHARRRES